ncbi:MAG: VOC family protein [Azospirillaceae bacterium]
MKLGYVILYVPDVGAAIGFYARAFGLDHRFVHDSGTYGELDTGATVLAFAAETLTEDNGVRMVAARPEAAAPAMEIALVTDDVAGG